MSRKKCITGTSEEDKNYDKKIEGGGFEGGMDSFIYGRVSPKGFCIGGHIGGEITEEFDFSDY